MAGRKFSSYWEYLFVDVFWYVIWFQKAFITAFNLHELHTQIKKYIWACSNLWRKWCGLIVHRLFHAVCDISLKMDWPGRGREGSPFWSCVGCFGPSGSHWTKGENFFFPALPQNLQNWGSCSGGIKQSERLQPACGEIGKTDFSGAGKSKISLTQLRKPQEESWAGQVLGNKNLLTEMHRANRRLIHKPFFTFFSLTPLGFLCFINMMILIFVLLQSDFLNSRLFCVLWGINLEESYSQADISWRSGRYGGPVIVLYRLNKVVIWGG